MRVATRERRISIMAEAGPAGGLSATSSNSRSGYRVSEWPVSMTQSQPQ
jgi:hypothetical protein